MWDCAMIWAAAKRRDSLWPFLPQILNLVWAGSLTQRQMLWLSYRASGMYCTHTHKCTFVGEVVQRRHILVYWAVGESVVWWVTALSLANTKRRGQRSCLPWWKRFVAQLNLWQSKVHLSKHKAILGDRGRPLEEHFSPDGSGVSGIFIPLQDISGHQTVSYPRKQLQQHTALHSHHGHHISAQLGVCGAVPEWFPPLHHDNAIGDVCGNSNFHIILCCSFLFGMVDSLFIWYTGSSKK